MRQLQSEETQRVAWENLAKNKTVLYFLRVLSVSEKYPTDIRAAPYEWE